MKLACSTVLFNQLDLYGTLQHLAWAGYDGAELACLKSHARHIEPNTDKTYIDEIKWTAEKHGIELLAIHLDAEGNTSEEKIKYVTKMFEVAKNLSIPVVAIPAGGKTGDKELTKREFSYIGKLCEQAESRGITLAVKYHKGASIYWKPEGQSTTCLHVGECKGEVFISFFKLFLPSFRSSEA